MVNPQPFSYQIDRFRDKLVKSEVSRRVRRQKSADGMLLCDHFVFSAVAVEQTGGPQEVRTCRQCVHRRYVRRRRNADEVRIGKAYNGSDTERFSNRYLQKISLFYSPNLEFSSLLELSACLCTRRGRIQRNWPKRRLFQVVLCRLGVVAEDWESV